MIACNVEMIRVVFSCTQPFVLKYSMQLTDRIKTQITLDSDLDLEVRVKATENRQTISDFVAEALRHYLKNYARIQKQAQKNKEPEVEY